MSWNQGGGPWGGGGGGSPWGRGPKPPNIEDILRKSQDRLRRLFPGGMGRGRGILLIALAIFIAIVVGSSIYTVAPDEQGVVLRFGAYDRTTTPGLNLKLPFVEDVLLPKVTRVNRVQVGFRTDSEGRTLMLTGDENIININFVVLWLIKDARGYLFNVRNPDGTVKSAAESAMREVIGHSDLATALTTGRPKIETETQLLLQQILDSYNSGVEITNVQLQSVDPPEQVLDAFRDVQSAKIDEQRLINEAQAYSNNVVPVAHGDAARIVQEAEAYRAQVVLNAQGDAARFLSVLDAYRVAEDVTARRLYIETMQDVFQHTNKVILDKGAAGSGVLPYLPLPQLQQQMPQPPAAPTAQSTSARPNPQGGSGQ
jgi:modulator of FtsH protease HflK